MRGNFQCRAAFHLVASMVFLYCAVSCITWLFPLIGENSSAIAGNITGHPTFFPEESGQKPHTGAGSRGLHGGSGEGGNGGGGSSGPGGHGGGPGFGGGLWDTISPELGPRFEDLFFALFAMWDFLPVTSYSRRDIFIPSGAVPSLVVNRLMMQFIFRVQSSPRASVFAGPDTVPSYHGARDEVFDVGGSSLSGSEAGLAPPLSTSGSGPGDISRHADMHNDEDDDDDDHDHHPPAGSKVCIALHCDADFGFGAIHQD